MKTILSLTLIAAGLCGCAQIPVERTYSLGLSDGKASVAASVTFKPPTTPAPAPKPVPLEK